MPFPTDTYLQFIRNGLGWVAQEFESFYAQLQGYLSAQHKEDGSHGDITGDSLTLSDEHGTGSVTADGDGTFGGNVTALAGSTTTLGAGYPGHHILGLQAASLMPAQGSSLNGLLLTGADSGFFIDAVVAGSPGSGPAPELRIFNVSRPAGPVLRLVYDVSNARHVISTENFGDGLAIGENSIGKRIEYIAATTINLSGGTDLSHYSEGSWTPALRFGGATTGITYTTQTGRYTRVGNRVMFHGAFLLSSKGSATGAATIAGLPFTALAGAAGHSAATIGTYITLNASVTNGVDAWIAGGGTTITLEQPGAGSAAALTDASFENTSLLVFEGSYQV